MLYRTTYALVSIDWLGKLKAATNVTVPKYLFCKSFPNTVDNIVTYCHRSNKVRHHQQAVYHRSKQLLVQWPVYHHSKRLTVYHHNKQSAIYHLSK